MDRDLLFLHIPKTSGTSVKKTLHDKLYRLKNEERFVGHVPLFYIEKKYNLDLNNFFIFSIVRNPFTRTFSYYKHFCLLNQTKISFSEFLYIIRTKSSMLFENKMYNRTPLINYSQSFYLYDSCGKINVNKIYRFENLSELENDFNVKLYTENIGNYQTAELKEAYDEKTISLVKCLYKEDFINFNYSEEFMI
jgi:hypothetical protein